MIMFREKYENWFSKILCLNKKQNSTRARNIKLVRLKRRNLDLFNFMKFHSTSSKLNIHVPFLSTPFKISPSFDFPSFNAGQLISSLPSLKKSKREWEIFKKVCSWKLCNREMTQPLFSNLIFLKIFANFLFNPVAAGLGVVPFGGPKAAKTRDDASIVIFSLFRIV